MLGRSWPTWPGRPAQLNEALEALHEWGDQYRSWIGSLAGAPAGVVPIPQR
ncbi:hypothetical protein I0C86_40090 [Plantactinospora sp. S1510]|uniref:Transcriptional regulator n=1 Tax=Plantactinospora alkalitolerans TaxID=2789879 RepID=A0ABS0H9C7_9ACTN|nr:hypothetical protein [Plantactinospora alkalitolerans]MBF9135081.1 hypothetical protein [Plantactinospora alkalitolerans]